MISFINTLFDEINSSKILYLVERNYNGIYSQKENDIDILVAKKDISNFAHTLLASAFKTHWVPVLQSRAYGGGRLYFTEGEKILRIDYMNTIHYRGIRLLNATFILEYRHKKGCFFIPARGAEAALSLMIPLMYHGRIKEIYKDVIRDGILIDRNNFVASFEPYLCKIEVDFLVKSMLNENYKLLESGRKRILSQYIRRNALDSIYGVIKLVVSYIHRLRLPTGILVAVLGPDGAGKSSVTSGVAERLRNIYPKERFVSLHWRPGFLPKLSYIFKPRLQIDSGERNTASHQKQNPIVSLFRWLYYTCDYIFGYWFKIFPAKLMTKAITVDRYYYDIVIDPLRYGFNLPKWFLKLIVPIIPRPDLTIYLDNEAPILHKRKGELSLGEARRQISAWREYIPSLPNARIVTTEQSLDGVVADVGKLVLERRAEMTKRVLKIDPIESFYLWRSDLCREYVALPSKRNCKWILPTRSTYARKSLDLYMPYSRKGRLYKDAVKHISAKGLLGLFRSIKLDFGLMDETGALRNLVEKVFERDDLVPAISTGTPGPFRKITASVMNSDADTIGYVKIAESRPAIERLKNETLILKALNDFLTSSNLNRPATNNKLSTPKLLYEGKMGRAYVTIMSTAPFEGKSGSHKFNKDYADVLCNFIMNTAERKKFERSGFYRQLKDGVKYYPLPYREIMAKGMAVLESAVGGTEMTFVLSHGDFAPWNMLWSRDAECFLFDWESAYFEAPVGIDLVHFLFQTGFLLKKYKGMKLLDFLLDKGHYRILSDKTGITSAAPSLLVLIYLLRMAISEDREQILSKSAVERRKLISLLTENVPIE